MLKRTNEINFNYLSMEIQVIDHFCNEKNRALKQHNYMIVMKGMLLSDALRKNGSFTGDKSRHKRHKRTSNVVTFTYFLISNFKWFTTSVN